MTVYFFEIDVAPTKAAANAADLESASALIFVTADSPHLAETVARSEVMDYGWEVKGVLFSHQPTDEQIAGLDAQLKELYATACAYGVGLLLIAHPESPGNPDDTFHLRSLGSPVKGSTKKH